MLGANSGRNERRIGLRIRNWLAALAFVFLWGCSPEGQHDASGAVVCSEQEWFDSNQLRILCTTAQVGDLVASVAGDDAKVLILIHGDLDPHSYQLVKGDDEKLASADIVFASGLELEHGPSLQQFLMSNSKVVRLGNAIQNQPGVSLIRVDGQLDPHIWLDVSLWKRTIQPIQKALVEKSPERAAEFQLRAQQLEQRLGQLDAEILAGLQAIPKERRYLVTSHDAFQYFTRRYLAEPAERATDAWKNRLCAPEGLAPEGQLSLADIQRVLSFCQVHHVRTLFPESNVSTSPLKKVIDSGRHLGLPLRLAKQPLFGDTMSDEGTCNRANAYEAMMRSNLQTMLAEWKSED
jgi:manganese/zinc/iron transport system substrate-binding protein